MTGRRKEFAPNPGRTGGAFVGPRLRSPLNSYFTFCPGQSAKGRLDLGRGPGRGGIAAARIPERSGSGRRGTRPRVRRESCVIGRDRRALERRAGVVLVLGPAL